MQNQNVNLFIYSNIKLLAENFWVTNKTPQVIRITQSNLLIYKSDWEKVTFYGSEKTRINIGT